jgi:hypothetical protein
VSSLGGAGLEVSDSRLSSRKPSRSRRGPATSMSHNVSVVPVIDNRDAEIVGRRRLPLWWTAGLFRYMLQTHDEEMSRAPQIGALIHTAIGLIAAETLRPTAEQMHMVANSMLDEFPKIEGRAHRQNIVAGIAAYFRCLLPPPEWAFHGPEVHLGEGRVDLLWSNFNDEILIDEVKTGNIRTLDRFITKDQLERYLQCANTVWGDSFVGIRLLSTSDPNASVFVSPAGVRCSLVGSGLVRGF